MYQNEDSRTENVVKYHDKDGQAVNDVTNEDDRIANFLMYHDENGRTVNVMKYHNKDC
jgi:hypothetical protein